MNACLLVRAMRLDSHAFSKEGSVYNVLNQSAADVQHYVQACALLMLDALDQSAFAIFVMTKLPAIGAQIAIGPIISQARIKPPHLVDNSLCIVLISLDSQVCVALGIASIILQRIQESQVGGSSGLQLVLLLLKALRESKAKS